MKTFISRIDGNIKNRSDFPPTINEGGNLPGGLPNIWRTADQLTHDKAVQLTIRTLSKEWNIDTELLIKIATHFGSVDESDLFIDYLDSENWDLQCGWEAYCIHRDVKHEIDCNPFI